MSDIKDLQSSRSALKTNEERANPGIGWG